MPAGWSELPVGQRDHPVGGVGLLLALDLLRGGLLKGRCEVAQVGIEFLGKHGEAQAWGGVGVPAPVGASTAGSTDAR